MSQKSRLNLMNKALHACSIGHLVFENQMSKKTFGVGADAIGILGDENIRSFDDAIDGLLESGFSENLSRKKFTKLIVNFLRAKKKEGAVFSKKDCDVFWSEIEEIPVVEHRVLREVFGVSIDDSEDPLKISCFTIYDWHRHKSLIVSGDLSDDYWLWGSSKPGILVECKVQARDEQKALELADILFSKLESIIRFMIGHRTDNVEFGILDYSGLKFYKHYQFHGDNVISGGARKGAIEKIKLDSDYFCNPISAFARLFGLLAVSRNDFEEKILRSVEWTAQAIVDKNPASAFIKVATSLEVLFSSSEKGVITPSIMAQISESCAHIIGVSPDSCVEIERSVKRLYSIRSAVVHSGRDRVSERDLGLFIYIAQSVVVELLGNGGYIAIDKIEKLHEMLRIKKYQANIGVQV